MDFNRQDLNDIIESLKQNFSIYSTSDCQSLLMLIYLRDYFLVNKLTSEEKNKIKELQDLGQSQLEQFNENPPIVQKGRPSICNCIWDKRSEEYQFWVKFISSPLVNKSLNYKE